MTFCFESVTVSHEKNDMLFHIFWAETSFYVVQELNVFIRNWTVVYHVEQSMATCIVFRQVPFHIGFQDFIKPAPVIIFIQSVYHLCDELIKKSITL